MWSPLVVLVFLALAVSQPDELVEAAGPLKVLGLFPHPGVSHFHFFHPIMRGLAEAGHDVSVVSHFPDKHPVVRYKDFPLTGLDKLTNSVDLKVSRKGIHMGKRPYGETTYCLDLN